MGLTAGSTEDGLILHGHWQPDGEAWIEVVHAEPRALFAGPLLRQVRMGHAFPFTEIDRVAIGGVLCIRARDRNLVYRLTEYDEQRDIYTGEWPD